MAAICFDVYGTLFDTGSVRARLGERLEAPAGVVDAVVELWRRTQLTYSYQLALMDAYRPFETVTNDALQYALAYYGLDPRAIDVDAALAAYEELAPFDDVEPTLDRLAEADHRLAILSNGNPSMLDAIVGNAGFEGYFEAVVSADEVATFKPAPAVYARAAERLEEPLEDCHLVSANGWDAAGAAGAGMGAVWVNRANDPPERVGGEPDLTVETLSVLPEEVA